MIWLLLISRFSPCFRSCSDKSLPLLRRRRKREEEESLISFPRRQVKKHLRKRRLHVEARGRNNCLSGLDQNIPRLSFLFYFLSLLLLPLSSPRGRKRKKKDRGGRLITSFFTAFHSVFFFFFLRYISWQKSSGLAKFAPRDVRYYCVWLRSSIPSLFSLLHNRHRI